MPKSTKSVVNDDRLGTPEGDILVGSPEWYGWLAANRAFVFEGQGGRYTAQREDRHRGSYWYAYRRRSGRLAKAYLGKSDELSQARLEQIGARLCGQSLLERLVTRAKSVHDFRGRQDSGLSLFSLSQVRPPAMPQHLVSRPRLTQRINTPITIICAPSGYGKSTLLNEWSQTCGRSVAWATLDADDNQPMRFWATVITALQALPGLEQILRPYLRIASASEISESVAELSNAIERLGSEQRFGLVLDDYHHIHHRKINATLQAWLEQTLPSNLQVVVSGHTHPRLALGHLRAKRHVTELETDDLRFTLGEGIDFLWQYCREQPLAYSEMEALVQRTEGWAAGLNLATLALSKQIDRRQFIEHFNGSHAYLSEYFMESVVNRQPAAVQTFLLKTAILKHLTGGLCEAVTGQADGDSMLAWLWHENLFIVRSEQQDWYRYHDLFAETLRSELQRRYPAEIPDLHRRAAEWYRRQDAPADAISHLLTIRAWEEAAALIEETARRELEQFGEDSRLLRWLLQLPESVIQHHTSLLSVYVRLAVLALSSEEAERILARAEADLETKPLEEQTDEAHAVLAQIQALRPLWTADRWAVAGIFKGSAHDDLWQLLVEVGRDDNIWQHGLEDASRLAGQLYEAAQLRHHLFIMLMAGGAWACRVAAQGQLRRAERIAQRVLRQTLDQRGRLPEPASIALTALGRVYYERNELTQAEQFVLRATEVDPNPTSSNQPITIAILRARIQSAQCNAEAAQATLEAARALQARRPARMWRERDLIAYQALLHARHDNVTGGEQLICETGEQETHPLAMFVWADILLRLGRWAEAESILSELLAKQPDGFYDEQVLRVRLMLALALFEQQRLNQARTLMTDVVRQAGPESFIRPFLDYGTLCVPLLTLVKCQENLTTDAQAFVKDVLRQVGRASGSGDSLPEETLQGLTAAASISAREQQVLRLAETGLSVAKMAVSLSVSTSTLKTHLRNIYRKLEVSNRTQAILKAQRLRLI